MGDYNVYRERERLAIIPGDSDRRGDPSGKAGVLEEVQGPGDLSPELMSGGCEIRSKTCSSFWCLSRDNFVSVTSARSR
jgi:hypothetical protein